MTVKGWLLINSNFIKSEQDSAQYQSSKGCIETHHTLSPGKHTVAPTALGLTQYITSLPCISILPCWSKWIPQREQHSRKIHAQRKTGKALILPKSSTEQLELKAYLDNTLRHTGWFLGVSLAGLGVRLYDLCGPRTAQDILWFCDLWCQNCHLMVKL